MTEKEIEKAKTKYHDFLLEKSKLIETKKRIQELEQNPIVKEYLNLIHLVNDKSKNFSNEQLIYNSFQTFAQNTENSNQILVYMGAYKLNNFLSCVLISDKMQGDFLLYEDLENGKLYRINPLNEKEFEKKSKIVHLNGDDINNNKVSKEFYENSIKQLRINFFSNLLNESQEIAINKISDTEERLKKGKKNRRV